MTRARCRRLRLVVAARPALVLPVVAVVAVACSASVPGSAVPQSGAVAASTSVTPRPGGCMVSANGTGSVSVSGGGSVVVRNRTATINCGAGFVELTKIAPGAVTLTASGSSVDVAVGTTGVVAGYDVTVFSVEAGIARFQLNRR